jgi:hypothetical protein
MIQDGSPERPEGDLEMSNTLLLQEDLKKDDEIATTSGHGEKKALRTRLVDGACIGMNIFSTVILVFLNNWYVCEVDWPNMASDLISCWLEVC